MLAALAFLLGPGDERPDILRGELAEPLAPEARDQVQPDYAFITLVCLRPPVLPYDLTKPVDQVLSDRLVHRGDRHPLVGAPHQLRQPLTRFVTSGIPLNALGGPRGSEYIRGVAVTAVFPQPDATLAVRALAPAAGGL